MVMSNISLSLSLSWQPGERLGYGSQGGLEAVRSHKWFGAFDWAGLKARTLFAPSVPTVRSPLDSSNFDRYPVSFLLFFFCLAN